MDAFDTAVLHLEAALPIAEASLPLLVGTIWGTWAKVHIRCGRLEEAMQALNTGEPVTRAHDHKSESVKFFAKKATVLALADQRESALLAFKEALDLHQQLGGRGPHRLRELNEAREIMGMET